jgi:hypothetical protein
VCAFATADGPQLLLAQLAASNPAAYFGVLDSSIRKEIDSGKLLQAAQLSRQGLGFYDSSSSSGLAGAQNPSLSAELLQDPAAVTALASAVACLTKVWVAAFQHAHEQSNSSSSSSSKGGTSSSSSGVAPGSPEELDFCVAATKRMLQLGLGSVLDWLLQINSTQQQQQQQQVLAASAASATAGACSSSSSTRQAIASSLFLLLVVARSALLTQHVMQTVAQQQQQQQQQHQASPEFPAVSNNCSTRASAQPSAVLQESGAVLQEMYAKCMRVLACLRDNAAALPAAAAAAAGADSNSSTVQQPTVVWDSLLQLQAWLQQSSSKTSSSSSSNSHAADGSSTSTINPAAAAAAAAAAADGRTASTAQEACMQLVAALPLPELCNNLSCSNLGGISEAAAAKKRCSGCKISR